MFTAPADLYTPRLHLRRPLPRDAAAIFAYASNADVTHFADWPRSTSLAMAASHLLEAEQSWRSGEEFFWVIELPGAGVIGGVGLRVQGDAADFGYVLNRDYWGRGFATEAAAAIVALAWAVPGMRRVWATCDAQNLASVRVLEKCGLTREALLPAYRVRPQIGPDLRDALLYAQVQ